MPKVLLADDVDDETFAEYQRLTEEYRRSAPRRFLRRWRCDRLDCDGLPHDGWPEKHARSSQVVPSSWSYQVAVLDEAGEPVTVNGEPVTETRTTNRTAYLVGGRGSGKTWAGAHNFAQVILETDPEPDDERTEWAVIAPTYRHARRVCIEGPSGLIRAFGGFVRHGGLVEKWNRSVGELILTTGAVVYIDGATDGAERIQGENLYGAWVEEVGLWKSWERAWSESLSFAVRRGPARIIATGTPKRSSLAKHLLDDPSVWRRRLRTLDNAANLAKSALDDLLARFAGTRLGQQELEGLLVDDVEGALWKRETIDLYRVTTHVAGRRTSVTGELVADETGYRPGTLYWRRHDGSTLLPPPFWTRIVVGLDPADGTEEGDEQGLGVVGQSPTDHELYLLESDGLRLSPFDFLSRAVEVALRWKASITVEKNHGGLYLADLLEQVFMARGERVPVHVVHAQASKYTRAEGVSGMWERGKVHHVDHHPTLEDQMCTWTGMGKRDGKKEPSPDRMDAVVWAVTEWAGERLEPGGAGEVYRWAGQPQPQLTVPTGKELPTIRW